MKFEVETKCIHGNNQYDNTEHFGSISYPIYQTATFSHPSPGESSGYDYSRLQNPTREKLEHIIADLEFGVDAMAFSTGMAAITVLMELFRPGDHLIVSEDLYGGSIRIFNHINAKNGLTVDYIDTSDLQKIKTLITPQTRGIFVETPTNPMMNVTDIRAVAKIAKEKGLLLIVDNTFMTPFLQNPLQLGADIVVHSGSKFLGGHNDTLAGFLAVNSQELAEKLRFIYKTTGACLAPFDSWLMLRGIKTLALRMERQEKNAAVIAEWLRQQQKVTAVYYAGLSDHPGYDVNQRQARGFGSMISFVVDSKNQAIEVLKRVKLIRFAESLGGVESLITYPITQTHADLSDAEQQQRGITETLLRLSVGTEHIDDLIQDLTNALA